jgi:pimeloyl-ACP methyl ester carboxylesterase
MPYALSDGVRIFYTVEGNGAPLVLHAGFGRPLTAWYRGGYVDALRHDYRLVLVDPRGQGRSTPPETESGDQRCR